MEVSFNDDQSSSILFKVNDIEQTIYTYQNGYITMSERTSNHDNTLVGYLEGLGELVRWLGKLKFLNPPKEELTEYELSNRIHHTYYLNQDNKGQVAKNKNILMHACYFRDQKRITFFPRKEIIIKYVDFRMALIHAQYFAKQIKDF